MGGNRVVSHIRLAAYVAITNTRARCRTVSDVTASFGGILVAGISVASSAMQQILCRFYLKKHGVSSHELLSRDRALPGAALACPHIESCSSRCSVYIACASDSVWSAYFHAPLLRSLHYVLRMTDAHPRCSHVHTPAPS